MAVEFELKNRIPEQDLRRIIFAKQEELLGQLNDSWKKRRHKEHQDILKYRPYDDNAILRIDYVIKLKSEGMNHQEAEKKAYEKFPYLTKDI